MKAVKIALAAAVVVLVTASTPAAAGSATFVDGTFNPADYTTAFALKSDPTGSIAISQCPACGNPDTALSIILNMGNGGGVSNYVGIINNTFSYDPTTQGAITFVDASVQKDITINQGSYNSIFHPMIEQGGNFYEYVTGVFGTSVVGPGTSGYETLSTGSLVAADFFKIDPTNGVIDFSANPDFSGGTMLFGLLQLTAASGNSASPTIEDVYYDNLSVSVNPVPEPVTLSVFGAGILGATALRRRKKKAA